MPWRRLRHGDAGDPLIRLVRRPVSRAAWDDAISTHDLTAAVAVIHAKGRAAPPGGSRLHHGAARCNAAATSSEAQNRMVDVTIERIVPGP
jgi:hypothetical protein